MAYWLVRRSGANRKERKKLEAELKRLAKNFNENAERIEEINKILFNSDNRSVKSAQEGYRAIND